MADSTRVGLWKEGYNVSTRRGCVREAFKFDKKMYLDSWLRNANTLEARAVVHEYRSEIDLTRDL
jgi:hypothetical protein